MEQNKANEEFAKEINATNSKIDDEVLDIMSDEEILEAIKDEKQCMRLIVNAFAEMLSEFMKLKEQMANISQTISTLGYHKLEQFFKEVKDNYVQEETRLKVEAKIGQSHKKPQNPKKNRKK